ncbi:MAG: PIN domain-containing protein [Solirubrobacteraceae bacterium]
MGLIVDTSVLVAAERSGAGFNLPADEAVGLSAVVLMEYWKGVERADSSLRRRHRIEFFERATAAFEVFPVTTATATMAARLWADLVRSGKMIGAVDLLIAASALERDWTLATLDTRRFRMVPGLRILSP